MREITLRQIEVIRAVMLRGTIVGAAEHLGVSAPGDLLPLESALIS